VHALRMNVGSESLLLPPLLPSLSLAETFHMIEVFDENEQSGPAEEKRDMFKFSSVYTSLIQLLAYPRPAEVAILARDVERLCATFRDFPPLWFIG
jgi:hypothetical protein